MKIKKFKADNLLEGRKQVAAELGNDAVILSSRSVENPAAGERYIEIVAAIDEKPHIKSTEDLANPRKFGQQQPSIIPPPANNNSEIKKELEEMKKMLMNISDSIKYRYSGALGPFYGRIYKALMSRGIADDRALKIVGKISADGDISDTNRAKQVARRMANSHIDTYPELNTLKNKRVIAFIGPTGSGKTLSLVKLAAITKLLGKSNVLIVSSDTYKVAGAEQLETFAAIANIHYQSVYAPNELRTLVKTESSRDYIFLDTTGRSQNNPEHMDGIYDYIIMGKPDITYLVMSATTDENTMRSVFSAFKRFKPDALIITKLDEAETIGHISNVLEEFELPVAYLTSGQRVPEDIEPANNDLISAIMLPDSAFE